MKPINNRQGVTVADMKKADIALNFHSPEFNQTDDLNDFSGNCTEYEALDGIVTADMRHQMERQRENAAVNPVEIEDLPSTVIQLNDDGDAGEDEKLLTVTSYGRTLIIDTDRERADACCKLLTQGGLSCSIAAPGGFISGLNKFSEQSVNAIAVTGAFGGFTVTTETEKGEATPTFPGRTEPAVFDLVLDLRPRSSFAAEYRPAGYYVPGENPEDIRQVIQELPEMKGRFTKPKFNAFLKDRCFHGCSHISECRLCLEICPVKAISTANREISINHYLCQGCGGCSLVCPADAIRMIHPSREEVLTDLKRILAKRDGDTHPFTLVIFEGETFDSNDNNRYCGAESKGEETVCFAVEQAGHIGLPLLLTAFSGGAGKVFVFYRQESPPEVVKAVEQQIMMARFILKGIGLPEEKMLISATCTGDGIRAESSSVIYQPEALSAEPAFPASRDKRMLSRLAAQYLYDEYGRSGSCEPRIALPAGSPFGAVVVDTGSCTMCMACATVCPSGALSAGVTVPRLQFIESRCHQCGLCRSVCPEGAIELLPRMFCDPAIIGKPVVIGEVEPFRCVECGAPFTTKVMVDRMREKLQGHRMFINERQIRRLSLCGNCRTRDTLLSEEASWIRR